VKSENELQPSQRISLENFQKFPQKVRRKTEFASEKKTLVGAFNPFI
jgi:hypothetical protein